MINWQIKNELKEFLLNYKNNKILDFGCGDARYKKFIEENNEYIGVDSKTTGFENSKKNADIYWDNRTLPFENESFDIIICTEVFHQVDDIDNTINELKRVLKKGGKLFITMPFIFGEHDIPYDFTRFTSFGIKKIFEKKIFKVFEFKKLLKGKNSIIQIIESEFTRYINEKCSKNFKFFFQFFFKIILLVIKLLFKFLPKDIFYNLHTVNLIILEK